MSEQLPEKSPENTTPPTMENDSANSNGSTPPTHPSPQWDYPHWVETFSHWLKQSGERREIRNLMDFFDRSGEWFATATELSAEEFAQKSTFLKRDLSMFFHHYGQDMAESDYVQTIKESVWKELADLTDKAQIEWQELAQDFRHEGTYEAGEWIGMGVIVCKNCHYKMAIVHPEEVPACPQCYGKTFLREALAP